MVDVGLIHSYSPASETLVRIPEVENTKEMKRLMPGSLEMTQCYAVESYKVLQCPKCESGDIHASRSRSQWETWRKRITAKRVYRCRACQWRGWGADSGPRFDDTERDAASRAVAPEPPNLRFTALSRRPRHADKVDLNALDSSIGTSRTH